MTAMADATIEQVDALGALTAMLVDVERTLSSVQAIRDGILAHGSRLALRVAEQAEHPDYGDLTLRTVAAEFGAALRVSDRTVQHRMADATILVERFPLVWAAQGAGRISAAHVRVIVDAGGHIEDAVDRDSYSTQVIEYAEAESPNRVARMARRIAERFQARSVEERHLDARAARRVWVKDGADGMAELGLLGPAALVHGAFDRLTAMATSTQEHDGPSETPTDTNTSAFGPAADAQTGDMPERDLRTRDQLRADLALDLLLTGAPTGHNTPDGLLAAIAGSVSVTVPVTTLIGVTTKPAELDGRTPIDSHTARRLAGAASGWDRILTHPITGTLLTVDRYRPSAHLRRHLTARDQRCRFPGCAHPARDSDIDHHHDAAQGGPTTENNLGHLCRRHHTLKHHTPWQLQPHGNGNYTWTSPTGTTYTDTPPPQHTITFTQKGTFTQEAKHSETPVDAPF